MTPQPPSINPSTWQPSPQPLSDMEGMLDANEPTGFMQEDPYPGINTDYEFQPFLSDIGGLEWSQWTNHESHLVSTADTQRGHQEHEGLKAPEIVYDCSPTLAEENVDPSLLQPNLTNVSQWLDGAYRPPVSCAHCRRHRLQCLILRTTPANPNPRNACSSCVALFRECSLAKGEKRLPSGFETFSPVLGHLHGVPEDGNPLPATTVDHSDERKEPKQFLRKGARVLQSDGPRDWLLPKAHINLVCKRPSPSETKDPECGTFFDIPYPLGLPMVSSTLSSLTPMERWQASPPEDEPVPETAIQNAIASGSVEPDDSIDPFQLDGSAMDFFNFDESSSHLASSVSSIGSKASETSDSASSAWSYHSSADTGLPFPLLPKQIKPKRIRGRQRAAVDYHYQCTFCTQSFKKKHDWARHEKSVHLTLDSWVCTPNLNDVQQAFELQFSKCPFCDVPFPTPAHWEEHEFQVCADKPAQERTFSRKDYLWQHLRKFHSCTKVPVADLGAWRGSGVNVESRCGFCGCSLSTWPARAEHLAGHFKKGSRMDQWQGDWGLDASALGVLRNAVPPSQRTIANISI
ncbi:hypothetical protein N7489_011277 [Penicillium chrysogenum]|uniref:uncharacterized protein n=1 Tax=Penicillium chrysogenum TaxID=5076 RepID=UPI0024DF099E|nr:uncharacterized protein N7489_011277 [Penicillium chrysogenum]KAJ5230569.1 hypothetical protein N7489_011277 [Penicillium chrysogenum]